MLSFFRLSIVKNLRAKRDKITNSQIAKIRAKNNINNDPNLIWIGKINNCRSTSREYTNNLLQVVEEAVNQLAEVAHNKFINKKYTKSSQLLK